LTEIIEKLLWVSFWLRIDLGYGEKSVQKNTASIPPVNVLSERFANDMACSPFV